LASAHDHPSIATRAALALASAPYRVVEACRQDTPLLTRTEASPRRLLACGQTSPCERFDDLSVEELEARFRVMRERVRLARWGGRALGVAGRSLGGAKLVALFV
jgi:hypothetical protein